MNPSYLLRWILYVVIVVSLFVTIQVVFSVQSYDQEDTSDDPVVDVDRKNETASIDLVGNSAAVQTWLAKQDGAQKPLSAFESSLKLEEVHVQSKRRNPKFEQVDPEIEKRVNRVHQFKFVE